MTQTKTPANCTCGAMNIESCLCGTTQGDWAQANREPAAVRTIEQVGKGRAQVLVDGKPIGTVRYESAYWWAYDLDGNPVSGGYFGAQEAAEQLPIPAEAPTQTVTITVELDGDGAALDTGRQLLVRADALERSFKFAAEDAPVRRTIANLRAVAAALMAQMG